MRVRIGVIAAALVAAGALASGAKASGEGGGETGVHFVDMEEINVPIVDANRVDGSLRVKIVLDAADAEAADRLTKTMPMLRQAAVGAALDFGRLKASAFNPVDVASLDSTLSSALSAIDKAAGHVLITEVSARRQ